MGCLPWVFWRKLAMIYKYSSIIQMSCNTTAKLISWWPLEHCALLLLWTAYACNKLSYIIILEIVDQWSTRIPPPHRRGWQWVDCNWRLFKITRQPFWKQHSLQSLGFCLQPQRTCTWNLKLKFQSKLELRCQNHAIQKPKNLIWPPGSHLKNEVTENQ